MKRNADKSSFRKGLAEQGKRSENPNVAKICPQRAAVVMPPGLMSGRSKTRSHGIVFSSGWVLLAAGIPCSKHLKNTLKKKKKVL